MSNTLTRTVESAAGAILRKLGPLDHATYSPSRCRELARLIDEIREFKARRKAVILAHNYQRPEIFEVADAMGDSLGLSRKAVEIEAEVIIFAGVHFMAETAAILNPDRLVLLPNTAAGCSLADTVDGARLEQVREDLQSQYPDLAVVSYVNTTAEVKALSDICCTSANAVRVVQSLPNKHILFVPDRNLAEYVQSQVPDKVIIPWQGNCYVHEQIAAEEVLKAKSGIPEAVLMVHPECRSDVVALARGTGGVVLSTEGMVTYAKNSADRAFLVVTECGLSDRLFLECPDKRFYKMCKLCQFMKVTTLEDVRDSLALLQHRVRVLDPVASRARRAIERMLAVQ